MTAHSKKVPSWYLEAECMFSPFKCGFDQRSGIILGHEEMSANPLNVESAC